VFAVLLNPQRELAKGVMPMASGIETVLAAERAMTATVLIVA